MCYFCSWIIIMEEVLMCITRKDCSFWDTVMPPLHPCVMNTCCRNPQSWVWNKIQCLMQLSHVPSLLCVLNSKMDIIQILYIKRHIMWWAHRTKTSLNWNDASNQHQLLMEMKVSYNKFEEENQPPTIHPSYTHIHKNTMLFQTFTITDSNYWWLPLDEKR